MVRSVTYITLRYVALIQVAFMYPEKTLISRRQGAPEELAGVLDPAGVPHVGQPVRVRDDLAREDRIKVPEQHQDGKDVDTSECRSDRSAYPPGRGRADEQPEAQDDADDQERLELERVVVELRPRHERQPARPARGDAEQGGARPPVSAGQPPAQAEGHHGDGYPPDGGVPDREHFL